MPETLGEFEQLILLAILRLRTDAYGVAIRRAIEEATGRDVSAGAVYTALGRMEDRCLVVSRIGETAPERTGQRRKYYEVLPAGAGALYRSYAAVRSMAKGLVPRIQELAARAEGYES